jgi:hypothetical protein
MTFPRRWTCSRPTSTRGRRQDSSTCAAPTLQFTFPDGSSQTVTLQDIHDKQFFELKASGVDKVVLKVLTTNGPADAPWPSPRSSSSRRAMAGAAPRTDVLPPPLSDHRAQPNGR